MPSFWDIQDACTIFEVECRWSYDWFRRMVVMSIGDLAWGRTIVS